MGWLSDMQHPQHLLVLITPYIGKILTALLILLIGRWLIAIAARLLTRVMRRGEVDPTLISFVSRVVFILGMSLIVIAALSQLGIDTTSAAAVLGGAAIAVGLSLQNQLSSFAAGVLLILFRPIRVGEWVEIAGQSGSVAEINIFYTTLTSFGNQMVVLPNNQVWTGPIINYARNGWRRIDLTVGVGYDSDLRKVREILTELIGSDKRILADPPATVALKSLGESSVDFAVRFCASNSDWWDLQCTMLERIKLRLDEEGIEIPFPKRDIHVRELPTIQSRAS